MKLKKEQLSLEDEICSYLPDQKMDQSSGEKPKRYNEEYYEEIEALGRFSKRYNDTDARGKNSKRLPPTILVACSRLKLYEKTFEGVLQKKHQFEIE